MSIADQSLSGPPQLHICIVTGQPQANLIPLLWFCPADVALIVSPGMAAQGTGKSFAKTLKSLNVVDNLAAITLLDFPDQNYTQMEDAACTHLCELLERFPEHKIVLNATGGTKLISQAWIRALEHETERCSVFYLDTSHNRLEWLQPTKPPEVIPDVLSVESALKAQGFTKRKTLSDDPKWLQQSASRKDLTLWLGRNAKDLDWLIGEINKALQDFDKGVPPVEAVRLKKHVRGKVSDKALAKLQEAGVIDLEVDASPQRFYIRDLSSLTYLKGGWIEEYVWWCIREAGITTVCCGMDQTSDIKPSSNIRNELDVVAVYRNHMLVIECKTSHLGDEGKYNDVLHKLDSLGEKTSGILGQRWLVLARMPQSGRSDVERDESKARMVLRAASLNIRLIEPRDLADMSDIVREWMDKVNR